MTLKKCSPSYDGLISDDLSQESIDQMKRKPLKCKEMNLKKCVFLTFSHSATRQKIL